MDITLPSLAIGLLLLLIPLYFLWKLRTDLVRPTLVAALRMIVQLFLISIYLRYLFEWDLPWLNTLWVIIMALIATHTTVQRTGLPRRVVALPAFAGFLIAALVVGFFFLLFVLQLDNPFTARYFVPIMGILMGNMLGVNVLTLSTFYSGIQREQATYYYLLGNGATRFEAWQPFMREAVTKSFTPCIANMAVMGIVSLPGTMIGQILGGSSPDVAIKYQMMIVIITMSASMLSLILSLWLSTRRSFDAFGRLLLVLVLCILPFGAQAKPKSRPAVVRLETTAGVIRVQLSDETPIHRDNFLKLAREGILDSTLFHRVIKDFMIQGGDPDSRVRTAPDGQLLSPPRDRELGNGDLGYTLPPEFDLPWLFHERGALAAAREGDDVNPEQRSSSTQFYIVYGRSWGENSLGKVRASLAENDIEMTYDMWQTYLTKGGAPHLDGTYTVFGHVIDGMKVVKTIQAVPTDSLDRPLQDVILLHAVVEK